MTARQIRIGIREIAVALAVVALVVVALLPPSRAVIGDALQRAFDPVAVADQATLDAQRVATERGVGRAYVRALDQVRQTRALVLPIPAAQADEIVANATAELRAVRRAALGAIGQAYGLGPGTLESEVAAAEARLDSSPPQEDPTALLAPALSAIVGQAAALSAPIADRATRAMASPVQTTPTPSPSR